MERVVGHLNNEKAAPPSLLEQSCGQGMHGRYLNQTSYNICLKNLKDVLTTLFSEGEYHILAGTFV